MDKDFMMDLYERCGKEFLMLLYERIIKELDEMYESVYKEKYSPKKDRFWEGVCDGIDMSRQSVERILKEVSNA